MNIPTDKQLHFLVSGYIFYTLSLFLSPHIALAITLAGGWGKELWDKRGHGCYEIADFRFDIYGIVIPYILLLLRGSGVI